MRSLHLERQGAPEQPSSGDPWGRGIHCVFTPNSDDEGQTDPKAFAGASLRRWVRRGPCGSREKQSDANRHRSGSG
jgi:hypothetical protein